MKKMCIDCSVGFAGRDEDLRIHTRCETSDDIEVAASQIQKDCARRGCYALRKVSSVVGEKGEKHHEQNEHLD